MSRKGVTAAEEAERRRHVFTLLDQGVSSYLVAVQMGVSENTIRRWRRMREEGKLGPDGFTTNGR
jgi:transposase-like protein